MKTIWIIDHYSSEPKYGGIQRQYDFANELSKRGYKIIIISSSFSHYTHTYINNKDIFIDNFGKNSYYAYLKTSPYTNNGGISRIKNMFSFKLAVIKNYKFISQKLGNPDIVVGCSIHPLTWVAAIRVSKKFKVKFISEVRDLWPEMWLLNGEKSIFNPMVIFFKLLESWCYKKSNKIIYSMLYGDKYFCEKLGIPKNKVALIGQPMDCERFDTNARDKSKNIPKKIIWFMSNTFTCVFTGYFMEYEGVYVMLEAAKYFHDNNIQIHFLFIGSGKEDQGMKLYVKNNKLDNVLIHDRINKELIPAVLKSSDVCLAHCSTEGYPQSFKYGVSKNKVNEYLYSGNPVIYGRDDINDPVAKYHAGYVVKPFNSEDFIEKIQKIYKMSDKEKQIMGENGRNYIIENHRVDKLVNKLLKVYDL